MSECGNCGNEVYVQAGCDFDEGDLCHSCEIAEHRADNARLTADIERLRGIVAKLPKCWRLDESDKLVQDVPIAPGDVVYSKSVMARAKPSDIDRIYVVQVGRDVIRGVLPYLPEKCYSTRAAAEAALSEGTVK